MRRLHLTALIVSLVLHGAFVVPAVTGWEPPDLAIAPPPEPLADTLEDAEDADEDDLPIEELDNRPFRVTIYEEPVVVAAAPPAAAPPEGALREPAAETAPVAPPTTAEVVATLPFPSPLPPPEPIPAPAPPPEPLVDVEPVLTEAELAALAEMEKGEASDDEVLEDIDEVEVAPTPVKREPRQARRGRSRSERASRQPPCPETTLVSIARVADAHWYIDRDLIEHYATNLVELNKLGWVYTHKGADGKLDGFRVRLKRCSVLSDGGLKSGDVVHDINGRRINTVLQAVGAYLALRKEPELQVRITRRGEAMVLAYTVEQPQRKGGKNKKRSQQAAR